MAYQLRPFRDYDEHDVLNLFAYDTTNLTAGQIQVPKGVLVKIATGWKNYDSGAILGGGIDFIGSAGTLAPNNVVSQRFGVIAKVVAATTGETPVGMMLYDVRDVDENGELLKYKPRKAAEMQAVIPGQAVPVVTRGVFLVQGVLGTPAAGGTAYAGLTGQITASTGTHPISNVAIGKFLGAADTNGETLVKLAL
jgi:hypothetical protein